MSKKLKQELVDVSELKPHPRNYKTHPQEQIDHLVKSIQEHGFYRNVVVARDNTILAGHGVVQAVVSLGMFGIDGKGERRVPVTKLDIDPDDPRALKVVISDNELGKLANSNDVQLLDMLKDVMTADELLGTGFDLSSLSAFAAVSRNERELQDKDTRSEWIGLPGFESTPEPFKVVMNFDTEEQRAEFLKLIGAPVGSGYLGRCEGKVWTLRWPLRRRADLYALRFDFEETAQ